MELPKNITQIGESDQHCKIFVEDYVVSYMKQLNNLAADKDMAVALYGIRKEEDEVSYLFLYGACKIDFLQRDTRHLSQAQQQEIERFRKKYFKEYTFLAYRLLNGEMIEGFHVCEQGICRYISGFSQFYEKNDSMLAYMLDVRQEVKPETVNQEKYEIAKKHQEERKIIHEESGRGRAKTAGKPAGKVSGTSVGVPRKIRGTVAVAFVLLCVIGLVSMNQEGSLLELQNFAGQMLDGVMQQKIPDAIEVNNNNVQVDTLVAEDKLTDAVRRENAGAESLGTNVPETNLPDTDNTDGNAETSQTESGQTQTSNTEAENAQTPDVGTENTQTPDTETENAQTPDAEQPENSDAGQPAAENTGNENTDTENAQPASSQPTSYIIAEGDTLIGISIRNYGSDSRVREICSLNQITNPDDIKVGQKILLP